jgi:hypothetical protein
MELTLGSNLIDTIDMIINLVRHKFLNYFDTLDLSEH